MDEPSRKTTHRVSVVAAVTSFIVQPIPAADELVVVPMHYYLVVRLARRRRVPLVKVPWRAVQKIIWYGAGARLVANFSLGLVPVVGMFSNAVTAFALTEFLGRWMDAFLDDPESVPPDVSMGTLRALFNDALKKRAEKKAA